MMNQELQEMFLAKNSIDAFQDDIERLKYNCEFNELAFSKGKNNYERILKLLKDIQLPNPNSFKFSVISLEEMISILEEMMVKILGDGYREELKDLSLKIVSSKFDFFSSVTEEEFVYCDKMGNIICDSLTAASVSMKAKAIYISDKLYNIQIASTGHEYVHSLLSKYKGDRFNSIFTNIHYQELLSILVEYILCYELSVLLKDGKLSDVHEIIRIYHDHEQAKELDGARKLGVIFGKAKVNESYPFRGYPKYQEHNAFTYIVGDIYAIHLLEYYKDDKDSLNKMIRAILDGEKSILDLIKYYDLSLRNKETIRLYNEQVNRTLKYGR